MCLNQECDICISVHINQSLKHTWLYTSYFTRKGTFVETCISHFCAQCFSLYAWGILLKSQKVSVVFHNVIKEMFRSFRILQGLSMKVLLALFVSKSGFTQGQLLQNRWTLPISVFYWLSNGTYIELKRIKISNN